HVLHRFSVGTLDSALGATLWKSGDDQRSFSLLLFGSLHRNQIRKNFFLLLFKKVEVPSVQDCLFLHTSLLVVYGSKKCYNFCLYKISFKNSKLKLCSQNWFVQ